MTRPTCKTCRYYAVDPELPDHREMSVCRRRSPGQGFPYAPEAPLDWCGEHKPIEAELKTAPTVEELLSRDRTHDGDQAKQKLWEDIGNTGHYSEWQEPQT